MDEGEAEKLIYQCILGGRAASLVRNSKTFKCRHLYPSTSLIEESPSSRDFDQRDVTWPENTKCSNFQNDDKNIF